MQKHKSTSSVGSGLFFVRLSDGACAVVASHGGSPELVVFLRERGVGGGISKGFIQSYV